MKHIVVIDNFVETPVHHSFNHLVERTGLPATYHMPAKYGFDSLKRIKKVDVIFLFGSASHVTEKLTWHRELLDWCIPFAEQGVPVVGLCFGHQLLAHHYGCEIGPIHSDNRKLLETRKVIFNSPSLGFALNEEIELAYSHVQGIHKLNDCFDALAHSRISDYEIIKHKLLPIWGLQSHPEASEIFLRNELKLRDEREIAKVIGTGEKILDYFLNLRP